MKEGSNLQKEQDKNLGCVFVSNHSVFLTSMQLFVFVFNHHSLAKRYRQSQGVKIFVVGYAVEWGILSGVEEEGKS